MTIYLQVQYPAPSPPSSLWLEPDGLAHEGISTNPPAGHAVFAGTTTASRLSRQSDSEPRSRTLSQILQPLSLQETTSAAIETCGQQIASEIAKNKNMTRIFAIASLLYIFIASEIKRKNNDIARRAGLFSIAGYLCKYDMRNAKLSCPESDFLIK